MRTIAKSIYLDSGFGNDEELPRAGSALENPYVYDAAAREFKEMAAQGLVEIVLEHRLQLADEVLIDRLRFRRLH